jgi:prepilin-type N-terminal cleavage/methylation domain-containing protein
MDHATAGRRRVRAFTLIELLIVVAIIAIVAAIALPNLIAARISSDESAAIATLKNIVSAEAVTKTTAIIDQDADGLGEYAWFAEMGGAVNVRDSTGPNGGPILDPTTMSQSLGLVNANGVVRKSGFIFRVALPGPGGAPVVENAGGGSPTGEDPDLCEGAWIVYTWPETYGMTGRRVFAVNDAGDVVQTDNLGGGGVYEGTANMPAPDAALENGSAGTIVGPFSLSGLPAPAVDGKTWKPVN